MRQPKNSRCCGQACLAMLLGITLQEAVRRVGHPGATCTRDLRKVLRAAGVECGKRRAAGHPRIDQTAVVNVIGWNGERHWAVWYCGRYWDPAAGVRTNPPLHWKRAHARVISYLEVML